MLMSSNTEKYSLLTQEKAFRKPGWKGNVFSLTREIYPKLTVNITVYSDMLKALSLKIRNKTRVILITTAN